MKALVVDDSKAPRTILKGILGSVGAIVEEAGNVQEGLVKLQPEAQSNIVFIDWNLPGMSGRDFVRAVRAHAHFQVLPLIMVTAETEKSQMRKALAEGANE